jgi:hypothetical protein
MDKNFAQSKKISNAPDKEDDKKNKDKKNAQMKKENQFNKL